MQPLVFGEAVSPWIKYGATNAAARMATPWILRKIEEQQ
jgi:hypothetical protein